MWNYFDFQGGFLLAQYNEVMNSKGSLRSWLCDAVHPARCAHYCARPTDQVRCQEDPGCPNRALHFDDPSAIRPVPILWPHEPPILKARQRCPNSLTFPRLRTPFPRARTPRPVRRMVLRRKVLLRMARSSRALGHRDPCHGGPTLRGLELRRARTDPGCPSNSASSGSCSSSCQLGRR